MLQSLRKILRKDPEKFYKVGKFTDPQTQTQRQRQTNENKSFDFCNFQNFAISYLRNYELVVFSLITSIAVTYTLSPNKLVFYQTLFFFSEIGIINVQKSSVSNIRCDLQSKVQFGVVLQGTFLFQIRP